MSVKLSALTTKQAVQEWPVISGFLAKGIERACGRLTIDDVFELVRTEKLMVLIAWDPEEKQVYAVFGIEALEFPNKKVFNITLAGGADIDKWGHLYPAFKEIAKTLGFNQMEVSGRAGWKRFLPGTTEVGRIFVEDLEVNSGHQDEDN